MKHPLLFCVLAGGLCLPAPILADQHELQWHARPLVGVALMRDEWASDLGAAPAAGASLGINYGVTNHLDLGLEALSFATLAGTFDEAAVPTNGYTATGPYERRARFHGGTVNATWRLGVIWVPVINVGVGRTVRYRSAGVFSEFDFAPMETPAEDVKDWLVTTRSGVEYRMTPRWTLGAYGSLLMAYSPDAPGLAAASLSFGVSYVHYPNW